MTDKREKYYDSKNIGCYMFKIDDHLVVDATMKGNAARFINHSCEVISPFSFLYIARNIVHMTFLRVVFLFHLKLINTFIAIY